MPSSVTTVGGEDAAVEFQARTAPAAVDRLEDDDGVVDHHAHGHGEEHEVHNRLYDRTGGCETHVCQRLPGSYHGSGCTLASALAGRLALGQELVSAVQFALDYTWRTLRDAEQPGHGQYIPRRLPLDAY